MLALVSCRKQLEFQYKEASSLQQTEWVVTRYDNTLTNISEFPQDTISFIDANSYRLNGGDARTYSLRSYEVCDDNEFQLILNNCSTFGGDFWSWIDQFSIDDGELNNVLFENGADNDIVVWMQRI
jgi:hypothetical protein